MTIGDTWRDLDEFLASEDQPDFEGPPVPAESLAQADRWLRAINTIDRQVARVRRDAEEMRSYQLWLIREWEEREVERIAKNRPWLERSVEMLARALYELDPSVVTRTLPNGTFRLQYKHPEWEYTDPQAFLEWAKKHKPDLVHQPDPPPPKPDKNAVKKAFVVNGKPGDVVPVEYGGDVVPGLRVVFRDREFEIKPPEA